MRRTGHFLPFPYKITHGVKLALQLSPGAWSQALRAQPQLISAACLPLGAMKIQVVVRHFSLHFLARIMAACYDPSLSSHTTSFPKRFIAKGLPILLVSPYYKHPFLRKWQQHSIQPDAPVPSCHKQQCLSEKPRLNIQPGNLFFWGSERIFV